ncbi:uncharacterized protein LOC123296445 [Chrysoperla carnea]|uniref:uncharacterized protein LOC123296445 n=1 Tax=Chrysoperla carnea TaxID=189513 RepID=UPI001D062D35|nr:uncharacterized protein LOC123296445 [Chrysoperla carnea]
MDPELTINSEVNEMNVVEKRNVDNKEDIDKKEDRTEKVVDDIVTKTEDGDKSTLENILSKTEDGDKFIPNKIEKEVDSTDSSKTESIVPELPDIKKSEAKNTRTDIIATKALVEKKPSKFKLWFLRTFFFKKFNKTKIDLKRKRHDLTVTESGVERSTSVTPSSSSSSSVAPIETISENKDKLGQQMICAPVSVVTELVKECGIID